MKPDNTPTWLSAHLYYNEPWEQFLTEAVLPFADIVMRTGIAQSFFFIRYWERGPHIRLRFRVESEKLQTIFEPNLEEHFKNYFDSRPSLRTEPKYPPGFPKDYKWHPNNTFRYETYEPELKRYGGVEGVKIAEEQFQASSRVVLESMLDKAGRWSYDDALGLAIKLHLSFVHSVGMSKEEACQFFESYFENWLPSAFEFKLKNASNKEKEKQKKEKLNAFNDAYILQKKSLIAYHKTMWDHLESEDDFDDKLLRDWISSNKLIGLKLRTAQQDEQLNPRSKLHRYTFKDGPSANFELWEHYADYIHMTNNRLGVLNQDEGYLGFLMMKCMNEMGGMEESSDDSGEEAPPETHFFLSF